MSEPEMTRSSKYEGSYAQHTAYYSCTAVDLHVQVSNRHKHIVHVRALARSSTVRVQLHAWHGWAFGGCFRR
jgi:hypothetical protein|eukprot:COSAG06_NODE_5060_length_3754_cov_1.959519_5_plen_72_part_00